MLQTLFKNGSAFIQDRWDEVVNHAEYEINQIKDGNVMRLGQQILSANPATGFAGAAINRYGEQENELLETISNDVEERTGIPSLATQVVGGLLMPGPGEARTIGRQVVQPVVEKGSVKLLQSLPAQPAQALTITNPNFIARGVSEGVATGPDFGPAMRRWNARRNELIEQRRNPQGSSEARRRKNARKSLETAYNDVSTGPSTDPLDPVAYKRSDYKVKGMQQHHLFPKQESYQFVERMKKIGDDDDVLNLFLYAEELDSTMGGRLSNMLNMNRAPHNNLHANRRLDGREMQGMKMKNLVASAKSTDELMALFDRYIVENIGPSKVEARQLQQAFDQAKQKLTTFQSLTEAQRRRL